MNVSRAAAATLALLFVMAMPAACDARPPFEQSHKSTFRLETGVGQCSGVAVGPHVIATASHCVGDGLRMLDVGGKVVEVLTITRDGEDAVLLRVNHTFKAWVTIKRAALRQGDELYIFGNPNGMDDILRRGYFAGRITLPTPQYATGKIRDMDTLLMELEATGGDSGSGIFDANGLLVCVLSGGYVLREDFFRLTRCHPFKFTKAQWDAARK